MVPNSSLSSPDWLPCILQKIPCNYKVRDGFLISPLSSPGTTFLLKALCADKSRGGQIECSAAFILAWSYSVVLLLEQCNG